MAAGCALLSMAQPAHAQVADTSHKKKADSLLAKLAKPDALKPYKDVITAEAKTVTGFFKVHKVDDKYYFEIPDSLVGRDILTVNRIYKSAAEFRNAFLSGMMSYAGDWLSENVIRFDKAPGNKMMLKMISYKERSNDTTENGMAQLIADNNMQPIYASLPVKAINREKAGTVIDVTDFLNTDNAVFGFMPAIRPYTGLTGMAPDRSYIDTVLAFPMNIEVRTVKTFLRTQPGATSSTPFTLELNSSIVLLPKEPMKARQYDPRVGYFGLSPTDYTDFDANPQGVKKVGNIWRWRMEPKPEDMDKYLRGELVEPQKPIIIYIDPLTPKKWVPWLMAGVNDWQSAFEKAGFKNAIMAKEAPTGDSTWSIDDARHSALVYKPSEIPNAMGPCTKDPRTGEILETHISWYHNVMSMLYKWYFIQAGAIDPRARKPMFDDALMGQLIRFVSSHEIGHTLGLRHNWGASSTVPVENLRNKAWVEAHGHTPSIMDYARFNYVAQPEDNISEKGIFPRIGDYDKWAIEWGYKLVPGNKPTEEENKVLNQWIVDKLKEAPQYYFGIEKVPGDAATMNDPRNQREDLGDDAMLAGGYGIKNLKRILPNLVQWTKTPGENYDKAGEMYQALVDQFNLYMGHVAANIGGVYTTPKTAEQTGYVFVTVPKEKQKRAMAFLQEQLFTTPTWMVDKDLYRISSADFVLVENVQKTVLLQLLDATVLGRLVGEEVLDDSKAYTATEMLNDLKRGIFSELPAHKAITLNRRNLQKIYVDKLLIILSPGRDGLSNGNDAISVLRAQVKELMKETQAAAAAAPDTATRMHLADLHDRLFNALKPKS